MTEGIQITIPDFADFDDDVRSTPTPFGRSGHAFGSSGFGANVFGSAGFAGLDSPSGQTTPTSGIQSSERSVFFHTRGDSSTSVESIGSATTKLANKSAISHASQPSLGNNPTGFSKKPSFASIRNAFKSAKNSDAPPVPSLDNAPYPILKNPFGNRSTSSLSQGFPTSTEPRANRVVLTKSRSHGPTRSHHSQSGSIFHASDGGSEQLILPSPPPVPRVPSAYGRMYQEEVASEVEDDKIVMDLKTPADYALHAVFIRFASSSEEKIDNFLRLPLDKDSLLTDHLGPGVDSIFDETLNSLGIISQRHAKQVIDSILRWRRIHIESVGSGLISYHMSNRSLRPNEIPGLLNERKSLASIYIMCRALISVLQLLSKDALGDSLGFNLEESTFDQLRKPDWKALQQSMNHSINSELYATLLGHLANVRFVSVTDRFLGELAPVAQGQVSKDSGTKYENLVKGLRHIRIKVWPPEAFEEGAEFMESLSKSFVNAHGPNLKIAFADTLLLLLHPIGKTVQAETNHPEWANAIEVIYPKAKEMLSKPRYWQSAFPLVVTCLSMAPQAFFLKHWLTFSENAISKTKDRPYRIYLMNGLMRIVWTYLYRCQESASTTMSKLENILKHFFPPNRTNVLPAEDLLEPLTYIVHFILSRHVEYGREICLDLLQESTINSLQQKGGNFGSILAPERISIVVNAVLLSLHNLEREASTPTWPTTHDFSVVPSREDYPTSSNYIPSSILKPGLQDFLDRCGLTLATITAYCGNLVGSMSVFDEQWAFSKLTPVFEESNNYIVRHHANGIAVAYPPNCSPHISILNTAFQAWPRFLHSTIELPDAVDLLLRGVIHVEPSLAEAAKAALKRFMTDDGNALQVISRFSYFLFHPTFICHGSGMKLHVEYPPLLTLWRDLIEDWTRSILRRGLDNLPQAEQIVSMCHEIEAACLFLLSHVSGKVLSIGVKVVRILGSLAPQIASSSTVSISSPLNVVHRLQGMKDNSYLTGYDDLLDKSEQSRLEQWRKFQGEDVALRIVESTNEKDRKLWRYVYPIFLRESTKHSGYTLDFLREAIIAVVSRYHPSISHLAGLSSRMPPGLSSRNPLERDGFKLVAEHRTMIYQWHLWMKILCAIPPDSPRSTPPSNGRDHSRAAPDASFERERYLTTRGLFRHLTPFLDSEYTIFRDAAVLCISSFPSHAYQYLLEDLSLLAGRQFYDDPRSKVIPGSAIESTFGMLGPRHLHDETRARSNSSSLLGDRTRRQERLHSAVARIYLITAPLLSQQRSSARPAALSNILKFVRSTQAFLNAPDMRENPNLNRLRRYFCGVVERLFSGLGNLKDSERFIPPHMHLTLYRLCDDWCHVGPMTAFAKELEAKMTRAVEAADSGDRNNLQRFRHELSLLSHAAVGALSSLCAMAFFPPDLSTHSPTESASLDLLQPLTVPVVLNRLSAIMASSHGPSLTKGKNALRALLTHSEVNHELLREVLRTSIVLSDNIGFSNYHIFEVLSGVVCTERHHFTFAQIICVCLTNLRHPTLKVRMLAFNSLAAVHHQHSGLLTMSIFESYIASTAPVTYIHAHRLISDFLAGEHPLQAVSILAQLGLWLAQLPEGAYDTPIILLLLQSLEYWIPNISLVTEDQIELTQEGNACLYHLTSLTLRFGQSHAEQISNLWTKLVDPPHPFNGRATLRFLFEQAHKVGSTLFITCASNIIASLCQTHIGRQVFEELCSVIEPIQMLPNVDHKLGLPPPDKQQLWEDLDLLFGGEQPRLTPLGSAQFAWLFLSDVALQRYWEMKDYLPTILHAIFTHIDHRVPFLRKRAQAMLFQILRSWTPGYDELPDRSAARIRASVQESIATFEQEAELLYWEEEESTATVFPKMKSLLSRVLSYLEPLAPQVIGQWGSLALAWGTACSIRAIAFRSLQIFRALMPRVKKVDFALLVGRLSSTIAASDQHIQDFTAEMIETIEAVANADELDKTLIPQVYWCACACLSTTVEQEFLQVVHLLHSLLKRIDLHDSASIDQILSQRPVDWRGPPFLQPVLLTGLRSSVTSAATMDVLQTLSRFQDNRLIDATGGRLRDLYTVALPWCLHAMDNLDASLRGFAESISVLAGSEKRLSIQRIMNSYSKSHFRTRDDFLRQSVSSLREFGNQHWTDIVTLLLGLVLNEERWLRIQAMQVLKILFQQRETRKVEFLGSELLMPLLRLLETDLAPQVLEVLEEPLIISAGGPAARHVLRMSMHFGSLPSLHSDPDSAPVIFGVPQESGWSIAQEDAVRDMCRANILAVFDSCSVPTRPSRIEFEPEVEALASIKTPLADDLGGLVKNLHELNNFFTTEPSEMAFESTTTKRKVSSVMPTRKLEARVAAILAKSYAPESYADMPQTPFLDVFNVGGGVDEGDDSDESSDGDSDTDAFLFDSLSSFSSTHGSSKPPSARIH